MFYHKTDKCLVLQTRFTV